MLYSVQKFKTTYIPEPPIVVVRSVALLFSSFMANYHKFFLSNRPTFSYFLRGAILKGTKKEITKCLFLLSVVLNIVSVVLDCGPTCQNYSFIPNIADGHSIVLTFC